MKLYRNAFLMLVAGALLAACASSSTTPAQTTPDGKKMAELVGPDEDVQKRKAIQTRLSIGIESLKARDPERARRHITRALEIDPDSSEALNAMALYYRYEGDEKREEEHYRKAIRSDSKYSQARNNYSTLLYRQGRYKEAIEQLEKAADDTNYDQRQMVFLNLGRSYAKVADYEKAESALQRSLRLDTTQPEALLEIADVYFAQGKMPDAQEYYNAYSSRARQSARSLWLGIRIASAMRQDDKKSSYEFQLEQMFKDSPEHALWRAWKAGVVPASKGTP